MKYIITIDKLRGILDKHLGNDKRVFIGECDSTSIREMDPSTLICAIIDDVTETDTTSSSSPGEAKQEPRGEVAPKTYTMPEGYSVDQGGAVDSGACGAGTTDMGYW